MAVRCNVSSKRSNSVMGVHNCVHGPRAYRLGLVMGQHIDIIAIYRRHRYYRASPGPTATHCSSCLCRCCYFSSTVHRSYHRNWLADWLIDGCMHHGWMDWMDWLPRPIDLFIYLFVCLFVCLFLCQQDYEKTAGPICMKFSGKVWSDHGTTWLHFWSIPRNRTMRNTGTGFVVLSHHSLLNDWFFIHSSID